jgi:hypothetical protein
VLIKFLPPESAVNTALRNDTPADVMAAGAPDQAAAPWSRVETLLAMVVDEIRTLTWATVQSSTEKTIPKPDPVVRPGVSPGRRLRVLSMTDAQRLDPRLRGLSVDEAQEKLNWMTGRG